MMQRKKSYRSRLCHGLCAMAMGTLACLPQQGLAAEPLGQIKQCVSELWDCGTSALKTYAKGIEAAGNVLWFMASNPDCVAGMISGNPVTVGATGLIVGLGAAGVVNKNQCEGDIYGVAMQPIAAALDEIIPKSFLTPNLKSGFVNVLKTQGTEVLKGLAQPLPVPAVPPSLGGIITCGCNALESGAEALEDIKTVARLAKETAQSCKSAANSCPGLKQVLQVGGYVVQAVTDPSSIVQDCDSMSRQQYVAARLRPLIPGLVSQFKENIPWTKSTGEKVLVDAFETCRSYYDSHCYKEKAAADFCQGPVNDQNFDPELWAEISKLLNGPVFDDYFNKNWSKLLALPACPAAAGISIGKNTATGETDALAIRNQNAEQCKQELPSLVFGGSGSYNAAVRDMLPQSREAWAAAGVRGVQDKPPLDQARLYFRRIMTSAAVVSRIKIKQRIDYYVQRDSEIKVSGATLAMPTTVLNRSYGLWAKTIVAFNANKCPKDAKGWSGFGSKDKLDYVCLKDLANSLGLETEEKQVTQEFGVIVAENHMVDGSFKGASPYVKASQKYFQAAKALPPKDESDANEFWKIAKPIADAEFVNIAANMFPKHAARVAANNESRKKQKENFDAFITVAEVENKDQMTRCQKTSKVEACKSDMAKLLQDEKADMTGIINVAYVGLKTTTEPVDDKVYDATISKLSERLKKTEKLYLSSALLYPLDMGKAISTGIKGQTPTTSGVSPNVTGAIDKGGIASALPKAGELIAPKTAIASPPTTTAATFGMRAAPTMASSNKSNNVALAAAPPIVGAKADKNLGPNTGLNASAATSATTPPPLVRDNPPVAIAMTPPAVSGSGLPAISKTNTPHVPSSAAATAAPFNEKQYRDNRAKEFLTQWLNRCKDNDCRRDVSVLLAKQLDEEVAQIKANVNAWHDKAFQERIQDIVEKRYEAQLKTEMATPVTAVVAPPAIPSGPVKGGTLNAPRITNTPANAR
ncbi:MAG: hypothetical protein RI918_1764 [Pseudomonadota bacterium]